MTDLCDAAVVGRGQPGASAARWSRRPLVSCVLLGVGLGGFVDGIVLHQILQWHHMLTATVDHPAETVAGLEANTLADGSSMPPRGSSSPSASWCCGGRGPWV